MRKPLHTSINEELQWLGSSLGLFSLRDKDRSVFRIFLELIKAAKRGKPLSSDELAEAVALSRGTVVHHLNKLIQAGLVVHDGKHYWLRDNSLKLLIDQLHDDIERSFNELRQAARELDQLLEL